MGRLLSLFRTTAVRLSALYLLLFTVCAVMLVFYVTAMSTNFLRAQTQEAVNEELRDLARTYRLGGIPALARSIGRRSRQPGANLYLMADPTGRILAGNVEWLEPGVIAREGWTEESFLYRRFAAEPDEEWHLALAQVIVLQNGMRILVGRDLSEPENFRLLVRRALMAALAIMGIGALAIWLLVGRRALQRIDRMSMASQKIMAGDLSQRLPVGSSGDEFDRLSESLNAMIARIEKLNEGLRQVSDNIAHDLKTPLTRLRSKAEAALAAGGDAAAYRRGLEETIEESDQLIRTFNALLMISRVESGSAPAELVPVNLSEIAHDAVDLYEPLVEEAGAKMTSSISDDIVIRGNRELMGQALSNLIDNALKYAGCAEGAVSPRVDVSLQRRGDDAILAVSDTGPGIPPDQREEVLQRFVRLDESRSKPGTGLGLSLVDAVASFHGGRLELADNRPGLIARMILPVSRA